MALFGIMYLARLERMYMMQPALRVHFTICLTYNANLAAGEVAQSHTYDLRQASVVRMRLRQGTFLKKRLL